jgi:maltooligosyltrehalose trehalohydrolase
VPNHFGPEGCVVQDFGKAFAERETGWGTGLNFNADGKDYMRDYMIDMMMHWLVNYHVDGLRIDAVQEVNSDATLKYFVSEIRNHPETAKAVLIPEHVDKTNYLTRPLGIEDIKDPFKTLQEAEMDFEKTKNPGFDLNYIFDFRNTLLALLTDWQIYDCAPSVTDLEAEFKNGYRYYNKYTEIENPQANHTLVYPVSHDELNSFGGLRIIPRMLAIELGLARQKSLNSPDGACKKPFRETLNLIKHYLAGRDDQLKYAGIKKEDFEKAYKKAQASNRLALGTVFLHPGQKMLFMGDQRGELAPFDYNTELPDHLIYHGSEEEYEGMKLIDYIAAKKGHPLGQKADEESRLNQKEFSDPELKENTLKYTRKLKQLMNENPALNNGNYKNIVTMSYPEAKVLHIHRYEGNNEILAVLNFGDKEYDEFSLKSLPDGEWEEVLNSNDSQYGGTGEYKNQGTALNRSCPEIQLPGCGMVIFKKKVHEH